jgi:hypothetical protein
LSTKEQARDCPGYGGVQNEMKGRGKGHAVRR